MPIRRTTFKIEPEDASAFVINSFSGTYEVPFFKGTGTGQAGVFINFNSADGGDKVTHSLSAIGTPTDWTIASSSELAHGEVNDPESRGVSGPSFSVAEGDTLHVTISYADGHVDDTTHIPVYDYFVLFSVTPKDPATPPTSHRHLFTFANPMNYITIETLINTDYPNFPRAKGVVIRDIKLTRLNSVGAVDSGGLYNWGGAQDVAIVIDNSSEGGTVYLPFAAHS